jgi:hypothetical protein
MIRFSDAAIARGSKAPNQPNPKPWGTLYDVAGSVK